MCIVGRSPKTAKPKERCKSRMENIKELARAIEKSTETETICWRCGDYFEGYNSRSREYCEDCTELYQQEDKQLMDDYLEKKLKVMWRRAVNNLEKQSLRMDDYYYEAQAVLDLAMQDYGKFRSSPEMMVAMELLRNDIRIKAEYKILKYRVDFFLPEMKVVLEVDGRLHDFKIKKDSNRDVAILTELNKSDTGWEIIRIPTKYIEQNLKQLVPAIKALYKERQRLRRKHGGFLPAYYSKHDTAQQLKVIKALNDEESSQDVDILEKRFKHEWKPTEL